MASKLQVDSPSLWRYWTRGKGLAKWASKPHPYTSLVRELTKVGVPPQMVKGLAARMFKARFKIWPGERKGDNPAGPG